MIRLILLLALAILLVACQNQPVAKKPYLDMDSLITAQVSLLSGMPVSLLKDASINGRSNTSTNKLDSLGWSHELDVFRQLDLINRPVYRNAYEVKSDEKDSQSNLRIHALRAKGNLPVAYLQFYYLEEPAKLKKIAALHRESNGLYSMERHLEMYFDEARGKLVLSGFFIEGRQKMTGSDSVRYTIRSKILF